MSGVFGPQPPAAPNPYQVSTAQTQSNIGTAIAGSRLNNVNQTSPYGTVSYDYQPSSTSVGGKNVPQITQTTKLTPQQQAILDQQQGLTLQTGGLASNLEKAVPTTAMNFNNAPAMPSVNGVTPGAMPDPNALPTPGAMPALQTVKPSALPNAGRGLPQLQDQPDVGQTAADARQAVYEQQAMYLDPQFQLQERQLHDSLQDQGIPAGSEAYNQAMDQFGRQKTFAYQSATDSAIKQGYDVANQQFQQGLAANQQGFQQGMDVQGTGFEQGMDVAQTGFGQNLASNQNTYQQGMGEQQNAFGQGMERATTGFNQGMTREGQQFNQGLQANQNLFGQGLQARQQGIGEASTLYNQPIQTLGALMSAYGGGNVQAPQASPYPSAVAPTDVNNAFGLAQAGNQAAYQGNVAQYGADVGGLSSLAGYAAMAGAFS